MLVSDRGGMGGISSIMNEKKHISLAETSSVTFEDVKGVDECRAELEEIVDYLKNPQKYHSLGAKMPKGILITGDPGTGKTLLAKAIAGESKVKFFFSSGSDFDELFVGMGAKRVRELFAEAKKNAPCIIFIDEIDALGSSRKSRDINYNRQTLNQLLVEMDGFEPKENILVIGATNFAESLDHALKRPGRFDKVIEIPKPDLKGRNEILQLYFSKVKLDPNFDINNIAKRTVGMTGADLANLVNLAALNAIKSDHEYVTKEDAELAHERIIMGVERKSLTMKDEERHNTAIHEAGHAIAAHFTKKADPVHKITILPRGNALGFTMSLAEKDRLHSNRNQILAMVDVAMGGRAAEEIFQGQDLLTTGCSSDMYKTTQIVYEAVKRGIFSELTGLVDTSVVEDEGIDQRDLIDKVVKEILEESYNRTKMLLESKKEIIEKLADVLLEKETIDREEFLEIVGPGEQVTTSQ